jgi:lipoprotein-anchoring transpeptidase ErfK/SrfK
VRWAPLLIPTTLVAVLAGGSAIAATVYDHGHRDRIAPGVHVGAVDVGGLRAAEARARVAASLKTPLSRRVTVKAGDRHFHLTARQLHEQVNVGALVDQAVALSHHGSLLSRTLHGIRHTPVRASVPVAISFSQPALKTLAARVGAAVDHAAVDAVVTPDATGLVQTESVPGVRVDQAKLLKRLASTIARPEGARSVTAHLATVAPKVSTASLAAKYPAYIIVDREHFTLRFYENLKLDRSYQVAIGQQGLETPAGLYDIQWKQTNPSWYVPNSPWAGKLAGKTIPPGPDDPIKARWMAFDGAAGIHGVDPSEYGSIGHNASHGCVRMRIPDVIDLYAKTPVGTPVFIA